MYLFFNKFKQKKTNPTHCFTISVSIYTWGLSAMLLLLLLWFLYYWQVFRNLRTWRIYESVCVRVCIPVSVCAWVRVFVMKLNIIRKPKSSALIVKYVSRELCTSTYPVSTMCNVFVCFVLTRRTRFVSRLLKLNEELKQTGSMNELFCHTRTMLPYHVYRVCSPIVQGQAPEICSQIQYFLYYFISKLRKYLYLFLAYLKPIYTLPLLTPTPRLQGKTWKISNLAHLMKSGNLGRHRQMNGSFRSTPWQIFAKRLTERLCL